MEIFNIQNTNSDKSPSFLKELINSGVQQQEKLSLNPLSMDGTRMGTLPTDATGSYNIQAF